MASDPISIAREAYINFVKERGQPPKRTVHLFNWGKYHEPPIRGLKFRHARDVLSNPPDVSAFLCSTPAVAVKAKTAAGKELSLSSLYSEYQKKHGKAPSTVARFHHFCESKGASHSYAECSAFWVTQSALDSSLSSVSSPSSTSSSVPSEPQRPPAVVKRLVISGNQTPQLIEEKWDASGVLDVDGYTINFAHLKREIADFLRSSANAEEEAKTAPVQCMKLLDLFKEITVTEEELSLWANYSGGRLFSNKDCAVSRLRSVLDYVDSNKRCSKHIAEQMRFIAKHLLDKGASKSDEFVHVLLLLASHGNVCNVMKEVAISNAFGIVTNQMKAFNEERSLEHQILKNLRDFRVLQVETLFHALKMTNNTHYIAGFHNELSSKIGVQPYNDEHISTPSSSKCKNWKKNLDKRYFHSYYNPQIIVERILTQVNEKKIPFQKMVAFLEQLCPNQINTFHFLEAAISIDDGTLQPKFVALMLEKLGIFQKKPKDWKAPPQDWDPIQ